MSNLTPELAVLLLKALAGDSSVQDLSPEKACTPHIMIGKKVIIRTYSAGVHFGTLIEKDGKEVILKDSRRLWYWKTTNSGISLSEIANSGVASDSKVCESVSLIWLEAVEIIPCAAAAIVSIEGKNVHKA